MDRKNSALIKAFAKTLRAQRKGAGLSQEEFAHRLELSISYISLLETENRQPTLTVLAALAAEFQMSLAEFVAEFERHDL